MRYFHCPKLYRRKPYGCGAGPFDGTQTFLDFQERCPKCDKKLVPFRGVNRNARATAMRETAVSFVRDHFGDKAARDYSESHPVKFFKRERT
jgi:hypothetical protein